MRAYHHVPAGQKTYSTRSNAIKAVEKLFERAETMGMSDVRYMTVQNDEGRWLPVFFGQSALENGLHFHFSVVA